MSVVTTVEILGGPHEVRLIKDLLKDYVAQERPSEVDSAPLKVEFMISLVSIIDLVGLYFISNII